MASAKAVLLLRSLLRLHRVAAGAVVAVLRAAGVVAPRVVAIVANKVVVVIVVNKVVAAVIVDKIVGAAETETRTINPRQLS